VADVRPELRTVLIVATYSVKDGVGVTGAEVPLPPGVKRNPYSSEKCGGFYARSFVDFERIVEYIVDYVEAVAIVNTVWYLSLPPISLAPLIAAGWIPTRGNFSAVSAEFENATITLYPSGKARMTRALVPEDAEIVARKLYAYLDSIGAFKERGRVAGRLKRLLARAE